MEAIEFVSYVVLGNVVTLIVMALYWRIIDFAFGGEE